MLVFVSVRTIKGRSMVVSPDLGEIVSLSLLSRSVPQVSLVMLTRLVVAE